MIAVKEAYIVIKLLLKIINVLFIIKASKNNLYYKAIIVGYS